jgi:dipeptidyl aminopeptidase/acylaminoacyl peptidase
LLTVAVGLLLPSAVARPTAQRAPFSLEQVTDFTFPSDLVAAPRGQRIAWAMVTRGVRNLFVADGPDFLPRQLTTSTADDGQELTSVVFTADGERVVYVRGGDHGANWPGERNLVPNPASSPVEPRMQVWSVAVSGGAPVLLGEGDLPVPSPSGDRIVFERGTDLWVAPADGGQPAKRLFFARGRSEAPVWSLDGRALAFESNRGDLAYIGIYASDEEPIRYLSPSTSRDSMPRWSPDGTRIAFVRQPGRGGPATPPLERRPSPWSLWVADAKSGEARQVWQSPATLAGSYPRVMNGANLAWGAGDRLVFLSYQDGWPHLYSVPASGGDAVLLTPGRFMVEHVTLTPDRRHVVYSANAGSETDDIERRHLFRVPVDAARPEALTSGPGLEWAPTVTADGAVLAHLASGVQEPPLPAVLPLGGGPPRAIARDLVPPDFPAGRLATPEHVVFKAPDGTEVHAQLFTPAQRPGRRPAVVFVHGGPPRQMLLGWHYMFYYANTYAMNQYLASRGFVVLSVNYRLGIGYGFGFHNPPDGGGRGAGEYQDVLAAGRYLAARRDVDATRIGIWGGSYGGYLTALALGRNSDVFAAGVDLHGVHGRASLPADSLQVAAAVRDGVTQAQIDEAVRVSWQSSPNAWISTWKSPVLLIHGDDDRNVRVEQTVDLAQRLRAAGVPFEEMIIPDDIHDFLLYRNWLRAMRASAAFLERQLKPE